MPKSFSYVFPLVGASLKIYPNGAIGFATKRLTRLADESMSRKAQAELRDSYRTIPNEREIAAFETGCYLGLSDVSNSQKASKPRGLKGISRYGRRLVESCARLMTQQCGKEQLSFLTLTLPPGTLVTGQQWTAGLHLMRTKVRAELKAFDLPGEIVGVTEVQEKRSAREGVPILHAHWLFQGKGRYTTWGISKERIEELWKDTCVTCMGYDPDTSFGKSTNIMPVRKDASAYLGKYMSKGSKSVSEYAQSECQNYLPSTWYTCTANLRTQFRVCTVVLRNETAMEAKEWLQRAGQNLTQWQRDISVTTSEGHTFVVGWAAQVRKSLTVEQFIYRLGMRESLDTYATLCS